MAAKVKTLFAETPAALESDINTFLADAATLVCVDVSKKDGAYMAIIGYTEAEAEL